MIDTLDELKSSKVCGQVRRGVLELLGFAFVLVVAGVQGNKGRTGRLACKGGKDDGLGGRTT